jgi:hypothetical protein
VPLPTSTHPRNRGGVSRTRLAGSLAAAAATAVAVSASLADGGFGAATAARPVRALVAELPAFSLVSPDARDAVDGEPVGVVPAPTPPAPPPPAPAPVVVVAAAVPMAVQALAVSRPAAAPVSAARALPLRVPPPAPAPATAPVLRSMLIGPGGLRTAVATYSDCSGNSELSHAVAAIDTCVAGPTYFVGHNYGVFTPLMSVVVGQNITYYDAQGRAHQWRIVSIRDDWPSANGSPRPTQRDVVAQFQTCETSSPTGEFDRIVDVVAA